MQNTKPENLPNTDAVENLHSIAESAAKYKNIKRYNELEELDLSDLLGEVGEVAEFEALREQQIVLLEAHMKASYEKITKDIEACANIASINLGRKVTYKEVLDIESSEDYKNAFKTPEEYTKLLNAKIALANLQNVNTQANLVTFVNEFKGTQVLPDAIVHSTSYSETLYKKIRSISRTNKLGIVFDNYIAYCKKNSTNPAIKKLILSLNLFMRFIIYLKDTKQLVKNIPYIQTTATALSVSLDAGRELSFMNTITSLYSK